LIRLSLKKDSSSPFNFQLLEFEKEYIMTNYFTHYWKNATWNYSAEGALLLDKHMKDCK